MISYDIILNYKTSLNGSTGDPGTSMKNLSSNSKKAAKEVSGLGGELSALQDTTKNYNSVFSQMIKNNQLKDFGANFEAMNSATMSWGKSLFIPADQLERMNNLANKMSQRFDMNKLSIMFFGMTIQKTFQGIYDKMLNTFLMIDKKGMQPLTRGLTRMEAAFTFLEFSIMKAMEPILIPIIDTVVKLVDWFSQLPDSIKQAVGVITIMGVAFGGTLSVIGNVSLGIMGIKGLLMDIKGLLPAISNGFSTLSASSMFGSLGALAGVIIIAAAAVLVFSAALEGYKKHSSEINDSLNRLGDSFENLVSRITGQMIQLPDASAWWDSFWSYLVTGTTGAIMTIIQAITQLLDAINLLGQIFGLPGEFGKSLASGKKMDTSGIDQTLFTMGTNANKYWGDLMKIGAEDSAELFEKTMSDKMLSSNANAPAYSEDFVNKYSQGLTDTSPVLNDTTTQVFTESTKIMKDIVHQAVEDSIADTNRAIAALRSLDAQRSASLGGSSSVTNNNNQKISITAASSNDISKALLNAKMAVPRL